MSANNDLEKLKLLYEENATQYRFFLTWRQLLLAGYFAIVAALSIAFKWCLADAHAYVSVCPFVGVWVSAIFWALDRRNLQLYRLAGDVGSALEEKLGIKVRGHFSEYQEKGYSNIRHAVVLGMFYIVSGLAMLFVGLLSFHTNLTIIVSTSPK
jgi:hypothetical protein